MNQICPICEKGNLSEVLYSEILEFRGSELAVEGLRASLCDVCGETSMSVEQLRSNNRLVASVKAAAVDEARNTLGLLYGYQVKQVREVLGLTQPEAAQVFGGGLNAFSKYERGDTKQSLPMDRLLRVSVAVPDAAAWLLQQAGLGEGAFESHLLSGSGDMISVGWNDVMIVESCVQRSAHKKFSILPLDEDHFDSTTWKDVPLAACAGWR